MVSHIDFDRLMPGVNPLATNSFERGPPPSQVSFYKMSEWPSYIVNPFADSSLVLASWSVCSNEGFLFLQIITTIHGYSFCFPLLLHLRSCIPCAWSVYYVPKFTALRMCVYVTSCLCALLIPPKVKLSVWTEGLPQASGGYVPILQQQSSLFASECKNTFHQGNENLMGTI